MSRNKREKYFKKETKERQRIELIQDFSMPNSSTCVKSTPDGRYIFATGLHLVYIFFKKVYLNNLLYLELYIYLFWFS